MNRREFASLGAAAALAASTRAFGQQPPPTKASSTDNINRSMQAAMSSGPPLQVAMLIYPEFTALDLVGPHTFLSALMNVEVHLVAKDSNPVKTDRGGLTILPTATLKDCPADLAVLFVPGGFRGTFAVMRDDEVLDFLADRGSRAKYVTSVCTGSLVLGCAGLLKGYRATSHWVARDLLPLLGATPVGERVVEDRNRVTGAGVTSGIDFGLVLASRMRDRTYAEMLQLINEYSPQPPFRAGTPDEAGAEMTAHLEAMLSPGMEEGRAACARAQKQRRLT